MNLTLHTIKTYVKFFQQMDFMFIQLPIHFIWKRRCFLKSNAHSLLPLQQSLKRHTILAEVEPILQNDTKLIRKSYQVVGALSEQMFPCHVVSNTFCNEGFHY